MRSAEKYPPYIRTDTLHSAVAGFVTRQECLLPCGGGHVEHILAPQMNIVDKLRSVMNLSRQGVSRVQCRFIYWALGAGAGGPRAQERMLLNRVAQSQHQKSKSTLAEKEKKKSLEGFSSEKRSKSSSFDLQILVKTL
ncbi:hypothetical protein TNCV_2248111 [Trichonephila clavipes]|nr:hypothetical protein TNCV_2248111 [Trichonephila clavipes]